MTAGTGASPTTVRRLAGWAERARSFTLSGMIERVATFCHRRRWTVLFAWIVVVIGVTMLAGALGDNDANGGRLDRLATATRRTRSPTASSPPTAWT